MRKRRRNPLPVFRPPERLATFRRLDWALDASDEDAVREWAAAREAWVERYYPGATWSPIGDYVDRWRARREARLTCLRGVVSRPRPESTHPAE